MIPITGKLEHEIINVTLKTWKINKHWALHPKALKMFIIEALASYLV